MPSRYISVQDDLRDLERRLLDVCERVDDLVQKKPLYRVASAVGTFAEMLPAYASLIGIVEKAYPAANEQTTNGIIAEDR